MIDDELLDQVNENDEIIGAILKSHLINDSKLIHRDITFTVFNANNKVLLQQRSMNKSHPRFWTTTVGHVKKGEDPLIAAKRELMEELGLDINPIYFKKIFKVKTYASVFFWLYYAVIPDEPKLTINPEEVMDSAWVNINELETFSKTHNYDINGLSQSIIM